jgi:hypothetical protein
VKGWILSCHCESRVGVTRRCGRASLPWNKFRSVYYPFEWVGTLGENVVEFGLGKMLLSNFSVDYYTLN